MRLFIAINFNSETRTHILQIRNRLRSGSRYGNFTLPENLHLTLVFLGDCDAEQENIVKSVLDRIWFNPFDITIDRIGKFKRSGGDLWWAGLGDCKALENLQGRLIDKFIAKGFQLDRRKFNPHITLGRQILTDLKPWAIENFGETIHKIELMKSERINGKLKYTSIYTKNYNRRNL